MDASVVKQIEEFVNLKPRSIQEIAQHIDKNWRTADRYVEKIIGDYGTLGIRTFREGTRGALKIVYWAAIDKVSYSVFQEQLENDIFIGRNKYDFSCFDIFQHIDDDKKDAWIIRGVDESNTNLSDFASILRKAEKQILSFSGNLSFINLDDGKVKIFDVLEELAEKGVSIKVVCRVDLVGVENMRRLLNLNHKYGKEVVQIRNREQPLRLFIIDNKLFHMKEIKQPTGRDKELNVKTFIFYNIRDSDWLDWLTKIFWKMFHTSIDASKRLKEMEKIS